MDIYRQNTHAHSVGWSTWHMEWSTKYRYKIFVTPQLRQLCLIAIKEAAKRHKISIVDAECDMDHVHVIAGLPLTMPPTKAVMLLKGISARILLHELPHVQRLYKGKHLWTSGKFMASIGHITLEKAKKYLEEHHTKKCPIISLDSGSSAPKRSGGVAAAAASLQAGEDVTLQEQFFSAFFSTLLLDGGGQTHSQGLLLYTMA